MSVVVFGLRYWARVLYQRRKFLTHGGFPFLA